MRYILQSVAYCALLLTTHQNFATLDQPIARYSGQASSKKVIDVSLLPKAPKHRVEKPIFARPEIPRCLPINPHEPISTYDYTPTKEKLSEATRSPEATRRFKALPYKNAFPPDTQGAAGPEYVMALTNDRMLIQTKSGQQLEKKLIEDFCDSEEPFDPKLVYDALDRRWIAAILNYRDNKSEIVVAISHTDNPLKKWSIYRIPVNNPNANPAVWADFPSVGFNKNWIVIQANMFAVGTHSFKRSNVYVLDKHDFYNDGQGSYQLFTLESQGGTQVPASTFDGNVSTLYLLQHWNGHSNGSGLLRLYAITGSVGNEQLNSVGFISVNATWSESGPFINGGIEPQLGTNKRIAANESDILGCVYRNGSLWACQTAFLPENAPSHTAAQWWQIDPASLRVHQFGRIEDPNATLDSGTSYAYPSIAVNRYNDVLIGYSFFNKSIYASSGYSFRYGSDPINIMRSLQTIKSGKDEYKDSGTIRWGDYSATVVDPVNNVDFWTIQESAHKQKNGDKRWLTYWANVQPR